MSYVGLYDDEGSKNAFYIIKDKKIGRKRVGFKEFENEQEAKFAHRVQKHLAQLDLAPMVYGDVGMIRRHDGGLTAYGYLTEVARTMPECHDEDCDGECFQSECKNGQMIQFVVDKLDSMGLSYNDAHKGNFGYVRRKGSWVLVVIDLGVESFSDWDTSIYGDFFDEDEEYDCNCAQCKQARNQYV
jgi:hypothetical protein